VFAQDFCIILHVHGRWFRQFSIRQSLIAPTTLNPHDIPNLITGLRIVLVVPIVLSLLQSRYPMAIVLFTVAGISDLLDGYLAKRHGWTSRLGGIIDPLADKLLLVGMTLALGWLGQLPLWLVTLIILRDAIIVSGAIGYHYLVERFKAAPLTISKINTLTQLTLIFAVLLSKTAMALPPSVLDTLIGLTALTTVSSGAAYVWAWGRRTVSMRK
jgi:cardiolipin synthase